MSADDGTTAQRGHAIKAANFIDLLKPELAAQWEANRHVLGNFAATIGLTGNDFHTSASFFPRDASDIEATIQDLRSRIPNDEHWTLLRGRAAGKAVSAFMTVETV
jgi:hypothetical protein